MNTRVRIRVEPWVARYLWFLLGFVFFTVGLIVSDQNVLGLAVALLGAVLMAGVLPWMFRR